MSKGLVIQLVFSILFHSAFRQHCEVWTLQFPFIHSFRNTLPLSEACLMVMLIGLWLRLSNNLPFCLTQSSTSLTFGKARLKSCSGFMFKITLSCILMVDHRQRSLTWNLKIRIIRIAEINLVYIMQFYQF